MNGYGSEMDAGPPFFWEAVGHQHGRMLHRKIMWRDRYSATGCSPALQAVDSKQAENLSVGKTKSYETVVKTPGLSSPCTMECGEGVLTAFGVGFTPHIQGQAGTDLCLRPHSVDTLLHLAIAPVAPLHRIRGRGQQRIVQKRQGLFQGRGKELFEGFAHLWKP